MKIHLFDRYLQNSHYSTGTETGNEDKAGCTLRGCQISDGALEKKEAGRGEGVLGGRVILSKSVSAKASSQRDM